MMTDMPDLSHLTAEERTIIENVIMRQRQEEDRENEIMKRKQNEVAILEDRMKQRQELTKKSGSELDATCHICLKTKFADGYGHICHYCNTRCCARCGGKVTLRSNKVIWLCMLCRKKQEIISKSGQWINKHENDSALCIRRLEVHTDNVPLLDSVDNFDKRPKLERARSAAEKENNPLQHSSGLRRQYSQHESPATRISGIDVEPVVSGQIHSQQQIQDYHQDQLQQQNQILQLSHQLPCEKFEQPSRENKESEIIKTQNLYDHHQYQSEPSTHISNNQNPFDQRVNAQFYTGELDGLMRQHPHLVHPRQQQHYVSQMNRSLDQQMHKNQCSETQSRTNEHLQRLERPTIGLSQRQHNPPSLSYQENQIDIKGLHLSRQRSINSSEENLCEDAFGNLQKPSVLVTSPGATDIHPPIAPLLTKFRLNDEISQVVNSTPSNIGGRIQIKLGYEANTMQFLVTIICAADLTLRTNGTTRNAYSKVFLLPDHSGKLKKRTKISTSSDPRWGQIFCYSGVRRIDLNKKFLEITVWDYVPHGVNEFLGETLLELANQPLDDEPEWYNLLPHQDLSQNLLQLDVAHELDMIVFPHGHLSPPSMISRYSDSDTTSECDVYGTTTDYGGASVSSLGSSASLIHEESLSYQNNTVMVDRRNQSAVTNNNYQVNSRRNSLSPPNDRCSDYQVLPIQQQHYSTRFQSRSATATPTGSPKKRQLPQVPSVSRNVLRDRIAQEFDDRNVGFSGRFGRYRTRQSHHAMYQQTYRSTGTGGWERHYAGLSDSDLTKHSLESKLRPNNSFSHDKDFMVDFCDSDKESVVSVTSSAFSTQSERPRVSKELSDIHEPQYRRSHNRSTIVDNHTSRKHVLTDTNMNKTFNRSLSNADVTPDDINDSSFSENGVVFEDESLQQINDSGLLKYENTFKARERDRVGIGMGKKSNSTSQLSATGRKRRMGFGKKEKGSFTVHRSEEVLPGDIRGIFSRGSSQSSDGEDSGEDQEVTPSQKRTLSSCIQRSVEVYPGSVSASYCAGSVQSMFVGSEGSLCCTPASKKGDENPLAEFLDGLGPCQLVGRQVLGAPSLGDIQLALCQQKGYLEIEVLQAKGLKRLHNTFSDPATYIKVYLVSGKKCIAKIKTSIAKKSLTPVYNQKLAFREPFEGCVLQVTVWGDYGRVEGRKNFMGVAQIMLDNLDLTRITKAWYKLYGTTTL